MSNPPRLRPVPSPKQPGDRRFESWKEIASFFERTTRTVRRWEQTEGLPVHRHSHHRRDTVYAFEAELDEWWRNRRARLENGHQASERAGFLDSARAAMERTFARRPAALIAGTLCLAALATAAFWFIRATRPPALSFQPREWVLITDFPNQTGDAAFEKSLWTAFVIGLQQSRHVNILPRTRIESALKRMGQSPQATIDETLGREICLRENIRGLVAGEIAMAGRQYALSARLIDPRTGEWVRSYFERADRQEEVLGTLGRIASRIRMDLGESLVSIRQSDRPLPQVTTPSLKALELYDEGIRQWRKGAHKESVRLYESALEHDPQFAMAHAGLGSAYCSHIFNNGAKGEEHYRKALQSSERITERERLSIQASYKRDLGYFNEALELHKLYLAAYPDDAAFRYGLGTLLLMNHWPEAAIEQFKEVIRVDPARADAFINIATSYREMNRSDDALPFYAKAFDIEPGLLAVANVNHEYGFTLAHSGEVAKTREVFAVASTKPDLKVSALRSLALLDMYEGKCHEATRRLQESILISRAQKDHLREARGRLFMAILLDSQGNRTEHLKELERAAQALNRIKSPPVWLTMRIGAALARANSATLAERLLQSLVARADANNPQDSSSLHQLQGEIALAQADYPRAIEMFLLADREAGTPETLSRLAYAYDTAGNAGQALATYEKLVQLSVRSLGWEPQQAWLSAHARLVEIWLSQGEKTKAARVLANIARLWKDADCDHPLTSQIARLEAQIGGRGRELR